jgi:hypothetical protein
VGRELLLQEAAERLEQLSNEKSDDPELRAEIGKVLILLGDVRGTLMELLVARSSGRALVAQQIHRACRDCGFFYITGDGVDESLLSRLEQLSRQFFSQDVATQMQIRMSLAGRAWRGYFPVGGELTSGQPDQKEGLYFGAELPDDHPLVQAETPVRCRATAASLRECVSAAAHAWNSPAFAFPITPSLSQERKHRCVVPCPAERPTLPGMPALRLRSQQSISSATCRPVP